MRRTRESIQYTKKKFAHDISLAIPNANYLFHIHADSSNLGTCCILIQQFPERELYQRTLKYSTKLNRKCPHSIENYAE